MLSLLLSLGAAHAKCGPGSSSFSPASGSEIADRAEIVWTATGIERDQIEASRDNLALVSGDTRIPLRVVEKLEGSFRMTQLVLAPTQPLPAGRWVLVDGKEPLREGWLGDLHEVSFTVDRAPAAAPIWRASPQVVRRTREELGCGPDVEVAVAVEVFGAQWIEATVREADGGSTSKIRLEIHDGQISIGHGMCSGPFELERGEVYLADLVAVGPLGQRVRADDSPIRFTAP